ASDPETAPSEDESCPLHRRHCSSDGEAAAKKSEYWSFRFQIWASDLEISRSEPDTGGSEVPLPPSEVPPFGLQKCNVVQKCQDFFLRSRIFGFCRGNLEKEAQKLGFQTPTLEFRTRRLSV